MKILDKVSLSDLKSVNSGEISKESNKDIAIIGIAGQFPDAEHVEAFWRNIRAGRDCIKPLSERRADDVIRYMRFTGASSRRVEYPQAGYLDEIDNFDCGFFCIPPKEADLMDPQQRLFLTVVFQAISDAGYSSQSLRGRNIGVYLGYRADELYDYKKLISEIEPDSLSFFAPANMVSILASRVSYIFDFKGPSIVIDTACSSSLSAVHIACQAIRNGECDAAVAGGVKLKILPMEMDTKRGIESSDGRTKTFDNSSTGTGMGEGVAAVLLKPLYQAIRDGDNIHAVIKGSAINQDGSSVGITAPNALAQCDVITRAWQNAGVNPESISYIEAHGTGTILGDPIEIEGIQMAFRKQTKKLQFCGIGSVKTNIGHLDGASGIAALIKMVMALKYQELPCSLHFQNPNRKIDFEDSPVYVVDKLVKWESDGKPRRCGISSFGMSGTNCHLILEEAPVSHPVTRRKNSRTVLTLSAKSKDALQALIEAYLFFLQEKTDIDIYNLSFTANIGRDHYGYRIALIIEDLEDVKQKIQYLHDFGLHEDQARGIFYSTEVANTALLHEIEEANDFKEMCEKYIRGRDIDWRALYIDEKYRRISIPSHPMKARRCWLDIPATKRKRYFSRRDTICGPLLDGHRVQTKGVVFKKLDKDALADAQGAARPMYLQDYFHTIEWNEKALSAQENGQDKGEVIIFLDKRGFGLGISDALKREGRQVTEVTRGEGYEKTDHSAFCLRTQEDYIHLFTEFKNRKVSTIIHLMTMDDDGDAKDVSELSDRLDRSVNSLFFINKAIHAVKMSNEIDILLITKYAHCVTGSEEVIYPENAPFSALGRGINAESVRIKCRSIDVDKMTGQETILSELKNGYSDDQIAYREGKRYVPIISDLKDFSSDYRSSEIKTNGVYIITGGVGGIGLEMAKYVAEWRHANIILINRKPVPERLEWPNILTSDDKRLENIIRRILEIEEMGSVVDCVTADISDENSFQQAFTYIKNTYGRVQGVFHCAGVDSNGILAMKSKEEFQSIYFPKVQGTWIIDKFTANEDLDFQVLFSSCASFLGTPGKVDYGSANAYLDSFSYYRNRLGKRTININWASWEDTEMEMGIVNRGGVQEQGMFEPLRAKTAMDAFDYIFRSSTNQAIIGKMRNFGKASNIILSGRENSDYTKTEEIIAGIWASVLGLNEINVKESFFNIGGHSLLAVKIQVELEKVGIFIGENDINTYSTVEELAGYISSHQQRIGSGIAAD